MITFTDFTETYTEFKGILETDFNNTYNKVKVLFSQYSNYKIPKNITLTYLLIAHFLVMEGKAVSVGINQPLGLIASSSVGSVNVSLQTAPYKNATEYYFYSTPYGIEYLAYLNQVSGICYVN